MQGHEQESSIEHPVPDMETAMLKQNCQVSQEPDVTSLKYQISPKCTQTTSKPFRVVRYPRDSQSGRRYVSESRAHHSVTPEKLITQDYSKLQPTQSMDYSWGQRATGRTWVGCYITKASTTHWTQSPCWWLWAEGGGRGDRVSFSKPWLPSTQDAWYSHISGPHRGHLAKCHTYCGHPLSCSSCHERTNELHGARWTEKSGWIQPSRSYIRHGRNQESALGGTGKILHLPSHNSDRITLVH